MKLRPELPGTARVSGLGMSCPVGQAGARAGLLSWFVVMVRAGPGIRPPHSSGDGPGSARVPAGLVGTRGPGRRLRSLGGCPEAQDAQGRPPDGKEVAGGRAMFGPCCSWLLVRRGLSGSCGSGSPWGRPRPALSGPGPQQEPAWGFPAPNLFQGDQTWGPERKPGWGRRSRAQGLGMVHGPGPILSFVLMCTPPALRPFSRAQAQASMVTGRGAPVAAPCGTQGAGRRGRAMS